MASSSGVAAPASFPSSARSLKLVLIGDGGVGKTALRSRFLTGRFTPAYRATIGADFLTKTLPADPQDPNSARITVSVWDTAGQERFASLGASFYRGADAVILAFDSTWSAARIRTRIAFWHNEFLQKAPIPFNEHARRFCWVCVGCKKDLTAQGGDGEAHIQAQVQEILDGILSRSTIDVPLAAHDHPDRGSHTVVSKPHQNDASRSDPQAPQASYEAMARRASKHSLRSTISVKQIPKAPQPRSSNSLSRSRSRYDSPKGAHQDEEGRHRPRTSSALGLTPGDSALASPACADVESTERTPTRTPASLPNHASRAESSGASSAARMIDVPSPALQHTFPVGTPSSTGSGSSNPPLHSGGIYVNGQPYQRDRFDSSVSNASTVYHTPRNSTFFASSPASRWTFASRSDSADGRARTSLESSRSGGSHPSATLRKRSSNDSVSSVRTVKGDGSSSLGHGSISAGLRAEDAPSQTSTPSGRANANSAPSSGRPSLEVDTNVQVRRRSSTAFAGMGDDVDAEARGQGIQEGASLDDGQNVATQHLARPRTLTRERSSDTVIGAPREGEEEESAESGRDGASGADSTARPQSGVSTDTDATERSWNQPTPRPGSWADRGGDLENEQHNEDEEEDEYGLKRAQSGYPIALEPIPFPSASSSAIFLEPDQDDNHLQPSSSAMSRIGTSKKDAALAEMERWREARSKKRRSRMGTGAMRVDSLRSGELEHADDGSDSIRGPQSSSGSASRSRTVSTATGASVDAAGAEDGATPEVPEAQPSQAAAWEDNDPHPLGVGRAQLDPESADTSAGKGPSPAVPAPVQASSRPASPTYMDPSDPEPPALEEGFRLFFTSAKTGEGVSSVFEHVVSRVAARWAYEEWEEREYKRAVREWRKSRRLGRTPSQAEGKRWRSIFNRGQGRRQASADYGDGRRGHGSNGAPDDDDDEEDWELEDEEEQRTREAVRRAIRVAAGKGGGRGGGTWTMHSCCGT
ncbi:hypothetical protein OC835_005598 [Tilletia horrida]|nr:hypothetical protein OC835_005598 [Tilletia horrida]